MMNRVTDSRPSYDTFAIDLEENALDSLVHAIEHYQFYTEDDEARNLKYTVLHAFHGVELLLKARLAKKHPLLIFDRPEEKKQKRTANFEQLIRRLENSGVVLKEHYNNLDSLRKARNSIEHHEINASQSEVRNYVGKAIFFSEAFLAKEFGIALRDEFDNRLLDSDQAYKLVLDHLYDYKSRLEAVSRTIEQLLLASPRKFEREHCAHCGEWTVLIPDPNSNDGTIGCFFCERPQIIYECEICAGTMVFDARPADEFDTEYCEDCQENYIFGRD